MTMSKPSITASKKQIASGVVHKVPQDLRKELASKENVRSAWNDLTPLARNEWICWVTSVKKKETRKQHIDRVMEDLLNGKRRPCCWIGCIHRTDKPISSSQKFILNKQSKK